VELNSRGGGTGKKSLSFAIKQPNNNGKCSGSTAESEYAQADTAEESLIKQGTDKVLNSSKTCKMKTIFVKEIAAGG